jgi:hypothetical protein
VRFYEPLHAAPAKPAVTIVSAHLATEPGKITTQSVDCPAGTSALSGGVASYQAGLLTIRSRPHGRSWQFRILSPGANDAAHVDVNVACLKAQVKTVSRTLQSGNGAARAALKCPAGYSGATVGWSYVPPDDAFDGFLGWELNAFVPAWQIRANDLASDSHSSSGPLTLTSTCARGTFSKIPFRDSITRGERTVSHRCQGGKTAVGGGFSLGAGQFFDGFAVTSASSARWTVYNQAKHARIRTWIVCMS